MVPEELTIQGGQFCSLCKGQKVIAELALLAFIVKFICYLYNTGVSHAVLGTMLSSISKYYIKDDNTGFIVDKHPLVCSAKITL